MDPGKFLSTPGDNRWGLQFRSGRLSAARFCFYRLKKEDAGQNQANGHSDDDRIKRTGALQTMERIHRLRFGSAEEAVRTGGNIGFSRCLFCGKNGVCSCEAWFSSKICSSSHAWLSGRVRGGFTLKGQEQRRQ